MSRSTKLLLIIICLIFSGCKTSRNPAEKEKTPEGKNELRNLYAFIGEKISVIEFDPNAPEISQIKSEKFFDEESGDTLTMVRSHYVMDNAFRCKYKVIRNLYNNLEKDTVEFVTYDHYGSPGFEAEKSVILYLSKNPEEGYFYHRKYQFDKIFKDKKDNYFSYPKFNSDSDLQFAIKNLKGFPALFKNEEYRISRLSKELTNDNSRNIFFKTKGNFGYPLRGIYLNQLIYYRLNTTFINQ